MPHQTRRTGPTLAQVAQQAGVSRSAASFVLSGRKDQRISKEVWNRVEQVAKELGYRPNAAARTLSTGISNSILLVSDYIATTGTANSMIAGVLDVAWKSGKSVFLAETHGNTTMERQSLNDMINRQVDAVIYASMFTRGVTLPEEIKGTPTILLNCWTDVTQWPSIVGSVVPDESKAGRDIMQLALRHGYSTDIAFLGDVSESPFNSWMPLALMKRYEGICSVLEEHGLAKPQLIPVQKWTVQAGYEAVRRHTSTHSSTKLLICANDQLAFGAYRALNDTGLSIGHDIGVVSFGDTDIAEWLSPGLTSVVLPHYEMGKCAASILMNHCTNQDQPHTFAKVAVPMKIVERASL